jgi:hypothetical protein
MLHYCIGALIWRFEYRHLEKAGVDETEELRHSAMHEIPIYGAFLLKIISLFIA